MSSKVSVVNELVNSIEAPSFDKQLKNFIQYNQGDFSDTFKDELKKRFSYKLDVRSKNIKYLDRQSFQLFQPTLNEADFSQNKLKRLDNEVFSESKKLKKIIVSKNDIIYLKLDFKFCEMLTEINFSQNRLEYLNREIFNGLTSLKSIDFSQNKLKSLDYELFKYCEKLKKMDFSHNQIQRLDTELLKPCESLKLINFSRNRIEHLEEIFFDSCKNLKEINFSHNQLQVLHPDLLKYLLRLESIDFSQNQLQYLHQNLLKYSKELKEINFSDNQLDALRQELFRDSKELERINFSKNRIKTLDFMIFSGCEELKGVDFSQNQIKSLELCLENCRKLENVNFSQNRIVNFNEDILNALKINLSNNKIESLNFDNLKSKLEEMYFSNNKIRLLGPFQFENLKVIDFQNNEISKLKSNTFAHCKHIEIINLSQNKIEHMNLDIKDCKNLNYLNFSRNQLKATTIKFIEQSTFKSHLKINFSNNRIERLPIFYSNPKNNIQVNFCNNIDLFDFSYLFSLLFSINSNERLTYFYSNDYLEKNGINNDNPNSFLVNMSEHNDKTFLCRKIDGTFLRESLLILFLNKKIFNIKEVNICDTFSDLLKKVENLEWFILDFLIAITDSLTNEILLNFDAFISKELNENLSWFNLEFKINSADSLINLCKRNEISLFSSFVNNDVKNISQMRIVNSEHFYSNISLEKCFEIIFKNENETIAVYLLKIVSQLAFNSNNKLRTKFIEYSLTLFTKLVETMFQNGWWDAIEVLLDIKNKEQILRYLNLEKITQIMAKKKIILEKQSLGAVELFLGQEKDFLQFIEDASSDTENEKNVVVLSLNSIANKRKTPLSEQVLNSEITFLKLIREIEHVEMKTKFLRHQTTKNLLNSKWKSMPRFIYYFNLLFYLLFLVFYSINIEIYTYSDLNSSLNVACKCVSLISISYFFIIEYSQLVMYLYSRKICQYFYSIKNLAEFSNFPLCIFTMFYDMFGSDIEVKSSLYSVTILMSYFIFVQHLNKLSFLNIAALINVIGKIIQRSYALVIVLAIAMVGFNLSFRNRSTYYGDLGDGTQMNQFNQTFEFNIFQIWEFSLGGIATSNMGIDSIAGKNLVNYFIYAIFIFIMPVMFINILTGISIDEVKDMIENAEAESMDNKIEYVVFMEKIFKLKELNKLAVTVSAVYAAISKLARPFYEFYCEYLNKKKNKLVVQNKIRNEPVSLQETMEQNFANLMLMVSQLNRKVDNIEKNEKNNIYEIKELKEHIKELTSQKQNFSGQNGIEGTIDIVPFYSSMPVVNEERSYEPSKHQFKTKHNK